MVNETSRTGWIRPRLVSKAMSRLWISSRACGICSLNPAELGVQSIAHRFADQIVRENGQEDGDARIKRQPPDEAAGVTGLLEHAAPTRLLHQTQPQETEGAFQKDGRGDAKAGAD